LELVQGFLAFYPESYPIRWFVEFALIFLFIFIKTLNLFSQNSSPIYFLIIALVAGGIVQLIIPFFDNFIVFCILFSAYGIIDGIFLSFIVPISLEVAQSASLSNQVTGYFFCAISIPVRYSYLPI
jgi:hypothetical protein